MRSIQMMQQLLRYHRQQTHMISMSIFPRRLKCYTWMYYAAIATTSLFSIITTTTTTRTFVSASIKKDVSSTIIVPQQKRNKKFIGANWKCNIENKNDINQLIQNMNQQYILLSNQEKENVEICVFVPYVYIDHVRQKIHRNIHVGSQSIYEASSIIASNEKQYKNTGSITSNMLQSVGCTYVLLGHSDRRNNLYEKDIWIGEKVRLVLNAVSNDNNNNIGVVITIGELLYQRQIGLTLYILKHQLRIATQHIQSIKEWERIVIAYEPVWAIGVGAKPCSPNEAQRILLLLRSYIIQWYGIDAANACRFTYTGSVDDMNCNSYSSLPNIDGFVVGRAGLDANKLTTIIRSLSLSSSS